MARMWLGEYAKQVNFEYFKQQIYTHTRKYPTGIMGNYSPDRLSEDNLGDRIALRGPDDKTILDSEDLARFGWLRLTGGMRTFCLI